jgi:molecular chaperone GrpE
MEGTEEREEEQEEKNTQKGEGEEESRPVPVTDRRFSAKKGEESEDETEEETEEPYPVTIKRLKAKLEKQEALLKEYTASFKKMQEENNNFRNRLERDLEKRVEREKSGFITGLLDIIDNLERAIDSVEKTHDVDSLTDGIKMIHTQFKGFLENEGVEVIESVGKEFDPNLQEALEVLEVSSKKDDNIVLEEIQKGYRMNGQLIRPAKVKVGKFFKKTSKSH